MDKSEMLDHLLTLAERLGVAVRTGRYEGKGGMGLVRGEWVLLIDRSMPGESRVDLLIDELCRLDYGDQYLPPIIRDLLDKAAESIAEAEPQTRESGIESDRSLADDLATAEGEAYDVRGADGD
ncbi:MAG: hypothetical protein AUJ92_09450 [Armatimonadetes bacterium CG2_30_59_28]|nr:hypothetical protein [Armatimonadota bacterium]OIO94637.1 MAG: hypothetical protein AUJ92_09450 [Armatimonadetes bacterium CG2_30_59_28]PIX38706.1 MAG: hypothetical protein COZ56_19755 [Armatimonadetes bacterium CG_4_8_14_3_um_filter_58_9]PJB67033.1 MAG: hypothetical protein CO095_12565 [Armatimonadetes bacterium CG_4_9_14_3_um_filter_58_7]